MITPRMGCCSAILLRIAAGAAGTRCAVGLTLSCYNCGFVRANQQGDEEAALREIRSFIIPEAVLVVQGAVWAQLKVQEDDCIPRPMTRTAR